MTITHRTRPVVIAIAAVLCVTWSAAAKPLQIWLPEPPSYDWFARVVKEEFVPEFESETGLDVEVTSLGYNQAWRRMLMQQGPDVIFTMGDLGLFMGEEGFLMPLNRFIQSWEGRWAVPPELLRPQFQTGEVFGLPLLVNLEGIVVYNKDVFAEVGLDPEQPPDTWDDLEEAARRATRVDGDRLKPGLDTYDWSRDFVFRVFLYQAGGRMWSPDYKYLEFHSRFGVQAAEEIASLYQAAFPPRYRDRVADGSAPLPVRLVDGDIAMAFGSSSLADRRFYQSRGLDVLDFGNFVARQDRTADATTLVVSSGVAISKFSDDPTAGWQFIKWLFRPDIVTAFHNRFGKVVPRTDVSGFGDEGSPLFPTIQHYLKGAVANPTLPPKLATRAHIFSRADGSDTAGPRRDLMKVYRGEMDAGAVLQRYAGLWQPRLDRAWEGLSRR